MKGLRGATTAENTIEDISNSVVTLVNEIIAANEILVEDIGAVIFSATKDLDAIFPAACARKIDGFSAVPLFDCQQMEVEGAIEKCIRVLLLVDTNKKQKDLKHIYQKGAKALRPDL